MADEQVEREQRTPSGSRVRRGLLVIGPGLAIAAAGVGAGDMVSSLTLGATYGLTLAWAVIIGALVKFAGTESIGRWYLATGKTPLRGFDSISRWVTGYFGAYSILIGFFYGAAIASATGLAVHALIPAISVRLGAVLGIVAGLAILWIGRYGVFQKVMSFFVAVMFVSIVGAAIITRPDLDVLTAGFKPTIPDGGLLYVLGVMGGVGMSIGLLSYGYWLRDRGWTGPSWVSTMRLDLVIGYVMTFVFMLSMMIVGAEFLQGSERSIEDEEGLLALADPFAAQFGELAKWLLLIGFFSAVFSSLVGGFNALAYVFSDIVNIFRGKEQERDDQAERTWPFRGYLLWMSFPPLLMLLFDQPILLVLIYAALGALFMPAMVAGLLWLMNSKRVPKGFRNGFVVNAILGLSLLMYVVLGVHELLNL
ncbi:MAG: divalent metal cation transporter [Streptosporangiales bacterium]|nr:divalent metal cation transporter [Streptosporangiales bacterium]